MSLRVGIAGLWHETNVYATERIGFATLDQFRILRGDEILERHTDTRTTVGGAIAGAAGEDVTFVPLVHANAAPWGTVDGSAYKTMREEIVSAIRDAGQLDGIFLDLHGAGVAQGAPDLEADLTRRVRGVAPRSILVTAFDLHANLAPETVADLDAGFLYTTYPHTDMFERGAEAMRTLIQTRRGRLRPTMVVQPIPMQVPPIAGWTGSAAMRAINERCARLERLPGIIDCSFAHSFGYAPGARASVVMVADGTRDTASAEARSAAEWIWAHRGDLDFAAPLAPDAIKRARAVLSQRGGPVVLNEANDNPGSGAPADGTHLLRALLATDGLHATLGPLTDPAAALACHRVGLGAVIRLALGGNMDKSGLSGSPIDVEGTVVGLSDGRFKLGTSMGAGLEVDLGPMAALRVKTVDVVISTRHAQALEPAYFETVGIDPRKYDLVCVKSINHFRAGFSDLMTAAVPVDGPGLSTVDVRTFGEGWQGCWPWDEDAIFA